MFKVTLKTLSVQIWIVFALIVFGVPAQGFADLPPQESSKKTAEKEEAQIPKVPKAPLNMPRLNPSGTFRCQRTFLYQGAQLGCDSDVRQDAAKLRPILQKSPEALAELDIYQKSRAYNAMNAYVSTIGVLATVASVFLSNRFLYGDGAMVPSQKALLSPKGQRIRDLLFFGGAWVAGNSFLFGLGALHTNELRLQHAVEVYNRSYPEDPVELQIQVRIPIL
ncbi:hypothetical protein WDW86_20665 [Bdellovibrionota bacterium FG-2]